MEGFERPTNGLTGRPTKVVKIGSDATLAPIPQPIDLGAWIPARVEGTSDDEIVLLRNLMQRFAAGAPN